MKKHFSGQAVLSGSRSCYLNEHLQIAQCADQTLRLLISLRDTVSLKAC